MRKSILQKFLEENFDYSRGLQGNLDYFHNVLEVKISKRTIQSWMRDQGIFYRQPRTNNENKPE